MGFAAVLSAGWEPSTCQDKKRADGRWACADHGAAGLRFFEASLAPYASSVPFTKPSMASLPSGVCITLPRLCESGMGHVRRQDQRNTLGAFGLAWPLRAIAHYTQSRTAAG